MADFNTSFSQGVQTGANLYSRAEAAKLERRQLEAQERRRAIIEPLEVKAMQQQSTLNALKIKQAELESEYQVKSEAAFTQASDMIARATDLADPALESSVLSLLANVPGAGKDPRMKLILETLQGAQTLKMQASRVPSQAGTLQTAKRIADLERILNDPSTSPDQRAYATSELNAIRMMEAPSGQEYTIETNKDGTQTVRIGPSRTANAPGSAQLQQKMWRAQDAISSIRPLKELINTNTTGIGGAINRFKSSVYGQFPETFERQLSDPALSEADRYAAAAQAVELKIINAMKVDSVMSEAERIKWSKVTPGIELTDNPFKIQNRLREIQKSAMDTVRTISTQLGQEIPLEAMTPMELVQEKLAGRIDNQTLAKLFDENPYLEQKNAAVDWLLQQQRTKKPIPRNQPQLTP